MPPTLHQHESLTGLENQLRGLIDRPIAGLVWTASAEASDIRRLSGQIVDRHQRPEGGRWVVDLWLADAEGGAPSAAVDVAVVTGTLLHTFTADGHLRLLSDAAGLVEIDVEITGAGSRVIHSVVLGPALVSPAFDWEA